MFHRYTYLKPEDMWFSIENYMSPRVGTGQKYQDWVGLFQL